MRGAGKTWERQAQPFLFLVPAGLAVGLALKEIALRRNSGDSPQGLVGPTWVPRSRAAVASRDSALGVLRSADYFTCKTDVSRLLFVIDRRKSWLEREYEVCKPSGAMF